jgi:hypothetical protein
MHLVRSWLIKSLLLVLSICPSMSAAAEPTGSSSAGLSVAVTFSSVALNSQAYQCEAEITDLASGALLAAPKIRFLKGDTGRVETGDETSRLVLEVSVNMTATTGSFTVTYSKAGKVVNIQKGRITLQ